MWSGRLLEVSFWEKSSLCFFFPLPAWDSWGNYHFGGVHCFNCLMLRLWTRVSLHSVSISGSQRQWRQNTSTSERKAPTTPAQNSQPTVNGFCEAELPTTFPSRKLTWRSHSRSKGALTRGPTLPLPGAQDTAVDEVGTTNEDRAKDTTTAKSLMPTHWVSASIRNPCPTYQNIHCSNIYKTNAAKPWGRPIIAD